MKPKRIQLKRTKGWKMPPNTVKVDRSTKWGNPFRVGRDGDVEDCVDKFLLWLDGKPDGHALLLDAEKELRDKNLACWCKIWDENGLRVPCHADVLLEIANSK